MIITYFRSSSFNCHNMCPMQYMGEYVLGWRGPGNLKADKGTIVHKALEVMALAKLAVQNGEKEIVDEVGTWRVNKKYILSKTQVQDVIEKVFDWYSTRITHHNWTEKDYRDIEKWTYKAMEYRGGEYDPRNADIVQAEAKFDFQIEEPWAFYSYTLDDGIAMEGFLAMKGTIDQISKIDDETYEILDWKTGRRLDWATGEEKTHEKLRTDPQLLIYYYAVKKMYPNVKNVLVTIYFINDGGPFTICFGEDDIPATERMLQKKFEEIKKTVIPRKNISWKCKKFCHMGKSTFEGTDVKAIIAPYDGHITKEGSVMSKCEQLDYVMKHRSMNSVVKNMSAPGHSIGKYKAPGAVE